jgi:hypothetical protein
MASKNLTPTQKMKPTKLNLIQLHKVVFIIAIIILAIVQNQLANKINFSNEKFNQQNSLFGTKILTTTPLLFASRNIRENLLSGMK